MHVARVVAIAGLIATAAGTAPPASAEETAPNRSASPIPSNYVDDFGPLTRAEPRSAKGTPASTRSSPIPSNYVDDFAVPAPAGTAARTMIAVETGAASEHPE